MNFNTSIKAATYLAATLAALQPVHADSSLETRWHEEEGTDYDEEYLGSGRGPLNTGDTREEDTTAQVLQTVQPPPSQPVLDKTVPCLAELKRCVTADIYYDRSGMAVKMGEDQESRYYANVYNFNAGTYSYVPSDAPKDPVFTDDLDKGKIRGEACAVAKQQVEYDAYKKHSLGFLAKFCHS